MIIQHNLFAEEQKRLERLTASGSSTAPASAAVDDPKRKNVSLLPTGVTATALNPDPEGGGGVGYGAPP